MAERSRESRAPGPAAVPGRVAEQPAGYPATRIDARLVALGVPAAALTEFRDLAQANGAGVVDMLLQKRLLHEA